MEIGMFVQKLSIPELKSRISHSNILSCGNIEQEPEGVFGAAQSRKVYRRLRLVLASY
jgi:hypothetical protein